MYSRVPLKTPDSQNKNLRGPSARPKPPVKQPNYMEIILRLKRHPNSLTQEVPQNKTIEIHVKDTIVLPYQLQ